jgi:uncharacterized protein YjbJ (UPF0337 family)
MSLENRLEATAKNLEGKVQEGIGELTGDQKQRVEGQIKQMEASTMHTKENLKDEAKQIINRA